MFSLFLRLTISLRLKVKKSQKYRLGYNALFWKSIYLKILEMVKLLLTDSSQVLRYHLSVPELANLAPRREEHDIAPYSDSFRLVPYDVSYLLVE